MHMADALISPAVGLTMCGASAAIIAYCSKKVRAEAYKGAVPLMGVLGAFIFAAQMINFTIPVTGSSGHLGGGMILAALLGPHAAFLTIASVLVVQALFFADGGLLALGCNIFNLGFFSSFIAYPFIYKAIIGRTMSRTRITFAAVAAAIVGLQLGSFSVVVETVLSGISSLPFTSFLLLMQPIHLAIGIVEGVVTAPVISFVHKARPEILRSAPAVSPIAAYPIRSVVLAFLAAAVLTGGVLSWFASEHPDGLEWSITKVTGREELKGAEQEIHRSLKGIQNRLAFLPGYSFKGAEEGKLGTSISGILGTIVTLLLTFIIGFFLKKRSQPTHL